MPKLRGKEQKQEVNRGREEANKKEKKLHCRDSNPGMKAEKGGSFGIKTYISVKFDSVKRFRLGKKVNIS